MILPSKHLRPDRALFGVGGEILAQLEEERTVSQVWSQVCRTREQDPNSTPLTFDWFILALCFLFTVAAIEHQDGVLRRRKAQ
jgi:hypothetical protein